MKKLTLLLILYLHLLKGEKPGGAERFIQQARDKEDLQLLPKFRNTQSLLKLARENEKGTGPTVSLHKETKEVKLETKSGSKAGSKKKTEPSKTVSFSKEQDKGINDLLIVLDYSKASQVNDSEITEKEEKSKVLKYPEIAFDYSKKVTVEEPITTTLVDYSDEDATVVVSGDESEVITNDKAKFAYSDTDGGAMSENPNKIEIKKDTLTGTKKSTAEADNFYGETTSEDDDDFYNVNLSTGKTTLISPGGYDGGNERTPENQDQTHTIKTISKQGKISKKKRVYKNAKASPKPRAEKKKKLYNARYEYEMGAGSRVLDPNSPQVQKKVAFLLNSPKGRNNITRQKKKTMVKLKDPGQFITIPVGNVIEQQKPVTQETTPINENMGITTGTSGYSGTSHDNVIKDAHIETFVDTSNLTTENPGNTKTDVKAETITETAASLTTPSASTANTTAKIAAAVNKVKSALIAVSPTKTTVTAPTHSISITDAQYTNLEDAETAHLQNLKQLEGDMQNILFYSAILVLILIIAYSIYYIAVLRKIYRKTVSDLRRRKRAASLTSEMETETGDERKMDPGLI